MESAGLVTFPVSELSADELDAMAYAAQQMIEVKGIDTSIAYAVVNDLGAFEILAGKPLETKAAKWGYAQFQIVSLFYRALGFKFTDLCECKRKTC